MGRVKKAVMKSSGRRENVPVDRGGPPQQVRMKREGSFHFVTVEPKRKKADDQQNVDPMKRNGRLYSEVVKGIDTVRGKEGGNVENKIVVTTGSKRSRRNDDAVEPKMKEARFVSPGASTMNPTKDSRMDEIEFINKLNRFFVIAAVNGKGFSSFYECCAKFMFRDPGRGGEIRKEVASVMEEYHDFYQQERINGRSATEIILYATTLALEINIILVKAGTNGLTAVPFPERHYYPRTMFIARDENRNYQFLRPLFFMDNFYKVNKNFNDPRIFLELGKSKGNEGASAKSDDAGINCGIQEMIKVESSGSKRIAAGIEQKDKLDRGSASGSRNNQLSPRDVSVNVELSSLHAVQKHVEGKREKKKRGGRNESTRTSKRKRSDSGIFELPKENTAFKIEEKGFKKTSKKTRKDAPGSGDNVDSCEKTGDVVTNTSGSSDIDNPVTENDGWAAKRKTHNGFNCPFCVHSFKTRQGRDNHVRRLHSSDRPFKCTECGANFATTKVLSAHKSRHQAENRKPSFNKVDTRGQTGDMEINTSGSSNGDKPITGNDEWAPKRKTNNGYNCPHCVQSFHTTQSREYHIRRLHSIDRPVKCTECGANFKTKPDLAVHKSKRHPESRKPKVVKIKIPSKNTSGSENGWTANRTISKGFDCPQCIRSFTSAPVRDNHVRDLHGEDRPFKCSFCGANYKTKPDLTTHTVREHYEKTVKCDFKGCEHLRFASSGALNAHVRQKHTSNHTCSICKQIFDTHGKLVRHRYLHKDGQWECNVCPGKTFRSRSDLGGHYAACHSVKKFKCPMCPDTELRTLARYGSHMKTAHPDVPGQFQCKHCDQTFHVNHQLYVHKMYHHGKDNICPECDKVFTGSYRLRDHINNVHGDGNLYKCEEDLLCTRTFPSNHRLQRHIKAVHEDRLFVCEYCESGFAFKDQLTYHLKYVHTTEKNFKCLSGKCDKVYKTKIHLNAHIKSAHKELQYVCDFCDKRYQTYYALRSHLIKVHGLEKTEQKRFQCHLCHPTPSFPTSASWNLHRIVQHSSNLAPKDAKSLKEVQTCSRNKVFVSGDTLQYFLDNSNGTCKACRTKFYTKKCEENHVQNYHTTVGAKAGHFHEKVVACQNAANPKERNKAFNDVHKLSRETFHTADKRRKVYDLLFLPEEIDKDQIQEYITNDKGEFYIYCGRLSMGFGRSAFISAHHTTGINTVATNLFAKLAEQGETKYSAYLINEKYVEIAQDSGVGLAQEKKDEALDIFTLFAFAKMYNRKDIFFQKLEIDELEKLSLDEIDGVFKDVAQSNGNILNLRRFQLAMRKKININTSGVDLNKYGFLKCPKCPEETPASISRFHSVRHHVTSHEKPAESVTEKLIVMKKEEFDAPGVYNLLRKWTGENEFWIYLAVGVDEKVKNTEEAFRKATSGYVGQCRNNPVSKHHFYDNEKMSGLKLLKDRFKYVYLVRSWRLPEASEMDRGEAALIVKGSLIFRKRSENPKGLTLVNKFFPFYAISNMFEEKEWQNLAIGSGSNRFDAQLPDFIKSEDVCDELVDLTNLIPTILYRKPKRQL